MRKLKEQMWSFTEAMTDAIDKRTPYNATHTKKVAKYAEMIALHINELHSQGKEKNYFNEERLDCLKMAALLHDVGKIGIPGKVMNKSSRLGYEADTDKNSDNKLFNRLDMIKLKAEIAFLRQNISENEFDSISDKVNFCKELVSKTNKAECLDDNDVEKLMKAFSFYFECGDEKIEFFTEEERKMLLVRKGTLTKEEREKMNEHVNMTNSILKKVHFNLYFKNVRKIAVQHHELLNGKGYPNHLKAKDLCLESRILTVADMCDALLAKDRPYKKPKTKKETFDILHDNAKRGEIDEKIVCYLEECLRSSDNKETKD